MGSMLSPRHAGRYKDLARLLWRFGRLDIDLNGGIESVAPSPAEPTEEAEELAAELERLGPTFVKLGQLLSTRADLLPRAHLAALSRLQDGVEPFAGDEARRLVEVELGVRTTKAFADFDPNPIAAASLAQVHRATMRDGRLVAVKVQRPGIREQIADDLEALEGVAELVDRHTDAGEHYQFAAVLDEFRRSLLRELDFAAEGRNLERIGRDLTDFDRLVVPQPVDDYTTSRVLTMDFVAARKITELSPMALMELDGAHLADTLFRAYLQQVLVAGFFHADPHPGNVMVTDDGRLVLLDLGMVARMSPRMQEHLVRLLLAMSERRVDETADVAIELGEARDGFEPSQFRRRVADLLGRMESLGDGSVQVGTLVMEVSRISGEERLRPPPELALLGKTMLNLDEVGHLLDPEFDPNETVREHVGEILTKRLWQEASSGSVFETALEAKEFVRELPRRVNRILDTVAGGRFEVEVDAVDEHQLMLMAQKVANRVTTGLVLAALIVGAAMLMRVETEATIFGYPALAIVLFLAAAAAGFILLIGILFFDEHSWGKRRRR